MQIRKFFLEDHVVVVGARNIPGASRTRATVINGVFHRLDHGGVLAHAEIVVGTPDGHFLRTIGCVTRGARKIAAMPLEIGENTIAAFLVKSVQLALEKCLEIHVTLQNLPWFWFQTRFSSTPDRVNGTNLRQKARFF
jgi:hypothetical protein